MTGRRSRRSWQEVHDGTAPPTGPSLGPCRSRSGRRDPAPAGRRQPVEPPQSVGYRQPASFPQSAGSPNAGSGRPPGVPRRPLFGLFRASRVRLPSPSSTAGRRSPARTGSPRRPRPAATDSSYQRTGSSTSGPDSPGRAVRPVSARRRPTSRVGPLRRSGSPPAPGMRAAAGSQPIGSGAVLRLLLLIAAAFLAIGDQAGRHPGRRLRPLPGGRGVRVGTDGHPARASGAAFSTATATTWPCRSRRRRSTPIPHQVSDPPAEAAALAPILGDAGRHAADPADQEQRLRLPGPHRRRRHRRQGGQAQPGRHLQPEGAEAVLSGRPAGPAASRARSARTAAASAASSTSTTRCWPAGPASRSTQIDPQRPSDPGRRAGVPGAGRRPGPGAQHRRAAAVRRRAGPGPGHRGGPGPAMASPCS